VESMISISAFRYLLISDETSYSLTLIGPCIVIYSYSTTNKMQLFLKSFILVKCSTCFGRSFRPSSGAQNWVYSNQYMSNSCCYLLRSGTRWNCSSVHHQELKTAYTTTGVCQTAAATCC